MFVRTCNMQTSWISAVYRHRSITAFHSLIPDITLQVTNIFTPNWLTNLQAKILMQRATGLWAIC